MDDSQNICDLLDSSFMNFFKMSSQLDMISTLNNESSNILINLASNSPIPINPFSTTSTPKMASKVRSNGN